MKRNHASCKGSPDEAVLPEKHPDPLARAALAGRTITRFPIIDAHSHVGIWALFDTVSLSEQVAEMDRIGIRVAAVSALSALSGDVSGGNDRVAEVIRRYPDRFIGYVHVNANYKESMVEELERCLAVPGFRGIKIYQLGVPYDDPRFEAVWKIAGERRLPVLAHTWGGDLTGLERAAARHTEVPVLAAHAGSNFAYRAYIEAARRTPNFYLDLTYSREHANMIECFADEVGAGRIVWGADAPLFSMAHQAAKVLCARIPEEDKRLILGGNAARIFGIDRLPAEKQGASAMG